MKRRSKNTFKKHFKKINKPKQDVFITNENNPYENPFKTHDGKFIPAYEFIVPIVQEIKDNEWQFIGTGSFIHFAGAIVTAKHVVEGFSNLHIIHFLKNKYYLRKIEEVYPSAKSDIAVCTPSILYSLNDKLISSPFPAILSNALRVNDDIVTWAYPKSKYSTKEIRKGMFNLEFSSGKIEELHPDGRDTFLLPGACCQTSMKILSGASGGPVFRGDFLCGVNSTSYDKINENDPDISYITPISEIFDLVVKTGNGTTTIRELIKEGFLTSE